MAAGKRVVERARLDWHYMQSIPPDDQPEEHLAAHPHHRDPEEVKAKLIVAGLPLDRLRSGYDQTNTPEDI